MIANENAPVSCAIDSTSASSNVPACDRAYRCSTTSVSLLVWKIEPCLTSRSRISLALTMLPLWQMPTCPCTQSMTIGCAFESLLSPAVE